MPKYYCDYCDTFLTHDSPSVRKTHCNGRKHKENVKFYYQKWMEDQAQSLIDATIGSASRWRANSANQAKWDHLSNQAAAFKASKALSGAFAGPKPPPGAILPPPPPLPPGARFPGAGARMPMLPNVPPPPLPPGAAMMMPPPPIMPGMRPPTGPPPPFAPPLAAMQALQSAQRQSASS